MKKVYASIALAAAVCGSASAFVNTVPAMAPQTSSNDAAIVLPYGPVTADGAAKIAKQKAEAKVAAGYYVETWYSRTSGASGIQETGIEIVIDGTDVTISGLWEMAVIKGTYNPNTGILRIPGGQETLYTGEGGAHIKLFCDKLTVDSENKFSSETEMPYIEFEYLPAGVKNNSGETVLVGGWYTDELNQISFNVDSLRGSGKGYYWSYAMRLNSVNEYYAMDPFVFNASEWTDCGNATLNDGWFRAYDGQGFPAYNVKCLKKGSEILLVDPYGASSPYAQVDPEVGGSINASAATAHGYLFLDIANPDCVVVRPFVNSGFNYKYFYGFTSSETSTDVSYPTNGFFACTTTEGQRYFMDHWTQEEIIEEADIFGDPLSTLSEDGVVSLPNCRVQSPSQGYLTPAQWTASSGLPIPMETTIKLPAGALGAVNGILNDAENAPVRYYNLQGVEIANPEAGQLVIVKEGKKATKTIVK